jgi:hypothetical protein
MTHFENRAATAAGLGTQIVLQKSAEPAISGSAGDVSPANCSRGLESRRRGFLSVLRNEAQFNGVCFGVLVALLCAVLSGCGGGYAGAGLSNVTASAFTIDAGQSIMIQTSTTLSAPMSWNLSGTGCSGAGCGLVSGSGMNVQYTAPSSVSAPLHVVVTGSLSGTNSTATTAVTVNPAVAFSGVPVSGTVGVAYSYTLGTSGGTGTVKMHLASGSVPDGLTFDATTGLISGMPTTAGTTSFVVSASDQSDVPFTTSATESIVVVAGGTPLSVVGNTLPGGNVSKAYTTALLAVGGTQPYTWSVVSGKLPDGLALSPATGTITGIPTAQGAFMFTAQVRDAEGAVATGPFSITIGAASNLSISTSSLPDGTVGMAYSAVIGVTGGTAPYSCAITSGVLPAGLTLGANCVVSGKPTVAGTANLTVKATDSSASVLSTTGPVSITINPAGATLTVGTLPNGTVGTAYSSTIAVTGGTSPYSCALQSGTLPGGLSLSTNCHVAGTPSSAGASTFAVTVTDASSPANNKVANFMVTISAATSVLVIGEPPPATVGTPYTGSVPVTGGMPAYHCVLMSGTLPDGLTLNSNCGFTGTPTTAGPSTVVVQVTDSTTPVNTTTGPITLTVQPLPTLTFTGSVPNATVGVAYTQTLTAAGGLPPYTYAVTAGALPGGLSLSSAGVISGTPTTAGASSFTVTATDSEGTPQQASLALVLLVVYPVTPNDGLLKGPYAFLFQGYDDVAAGLLAYQTATVGSFTADGAGVLTVGEQDANHQTASTSDTIIATQTLLGTYTIGDDDRGSMTISTLNADGTVDSSITYAISVKVPAAPATVSTQGDLIDSDQNGLVGMRGSGTFLAQTAAAYATGLSGSYAFGMEGDTPCLPSCTLGLQAGPVATVGAFEANGPGVLGGSADTNLTSVTYPNATLSGMATASDNNGRIGLSMSNTSIPSGAYPADFAVYVVDASHAFMMSTDKHSDYILLAGSATLQSQTTFTNAALDGAYVGYENAQSNPGLLGAVLQNVLNLSTATIFRGTNNGSGTCNTTNVDTAGLTGLVDGLTGLGSGSNVLNALLGTYQTTGNSTCTVSANGRAVLNYPVPDTLLTTLLRLLGIKADPPPARVAYLTGTNTGYFLETGYAGLGHLELQTGAPFTKATLKGTFVYGTTVASSLASINASGIFTADGAGNAKTTLDLNVGVGNLNVIQLGTTANSSYTLSNAAEGRYTLGATTVVYAISPGRFVLLDTNPLATSPSVTLLH